MRPSFIRRNRRRSKPTNEGNFFKKDSAQEQGFATGAEHDGFFQPQATIQRKNEGSDKKDDDKKLHRSTDKQEDEKQLLRTTDKKEDDKKLHRASDKKDEDKTLQKAEGGGAVAATGGSTASYVNSISGKGSAMPKSTQQFFASRMGYDFSNVKIHNGSEAARSARDINAKAYTLGNNVVFNEGQFAPDTDAGKRLLAHELTHVMQQQPQKIHREITTPLPKDAVVDELSGEATFAVNKVNVTVEPDLQLSGDKTTWHGVEYEIPANDAETDFDLQYHLSFTTKNGKVDTVSVDYSISIKTMYGKHAKKSGDSDYGRGTTEQDKKDKNTSLKFHESRHGQDFQDYISTKPLPTFGLKLPATQDAYNKRTITFDKDVTAYKNALRAYSVKNTDKVGKPKPD